MSDDTPYLRAILALLARRAFPPERLAVIVGREKQATAYNLCDGTRSQAEIAKESGLDPSNFRKAMNRWIETGVVIKVADGREQRPLHVYPLTERKGNGGEG